MKNLNFGCRRSDFLISPSNWQALKKDSPAFEWFVMCRFYEPGQKAFIFKKKITPSLPLADKKASIGVLKKMMEEYLDRDYNPRTKSYMFPNEGIHKGLYFMDALDLVLEGRDISHGYKKSTEHYLRKMRNHSTELRLDYLKVCDVTLPDIKKIFTAAAVSNCDYNKMKKNVSPLFADLVDEGCISVNPCTGIKTKNHLTATKKIFSDEKFTEVMKHIAEDRPNFLNYFMCFTMSGCRTTEILGITTYDVDLENREFTITMGKGGQIKRETRVIFPDALPYWENQMALCEPGDFLFGEGFLPNAIPKKANSVYLYWRNYIMTPLGITNTIYSLKHYFLDKLDAANHDAGKAAGHRNREITAIYTVGKRKREMEYLKTIDIGIT